jgi:hypothetical protein
MNPIAYKIAWGSIQLCGVAVLVLIACYFSLQALDAVLRAAHVHATVIDWIWNRKSFKRFMCSHDGARFRFEEEHADSTPAAARKRLERGES